MCVAVDCALGYQMLCAWVGPCHSLSMDTANCKGLGFRVMDTADCTDHACALKGLARSGLCSSKCCFRDWDLGFRV